MSPDGERVAFVVSTVDVERNTTRSIIWIDDAPVSAGDHDANPSWSPDGRHLAFTSRRGEKKGDSTLHVLPVAAPGEMRTVCTMPDGLADVAWSPDRRWLAFTSRTRDARYAADDESWQAPRKVERFFSRLNGEDWIFDRPSHVYAVAADGTGTPHNLTPGEHQHRGVAWLSDSTGVITSAQRHATWDRDLATDLYLVPLDTTNGESHIRPLTSHDGSYASPSVSPDGSMVAFIGFDDLETFPQNSMVGVLPLTNLEHSTDTGIEINCVSAGLDRTFAPTLGSTSPVWSGNESLLAVAEDRGDTHLFRIDVAGGTAPTRLTPGPVTIESISAAGGRVATTRTTVDHPTELYIGDQKSSSVADNFARQSLGWRSSACRRQTALTRSTPG